MDKLVWKFGYTRHVPIHAKQVIDNKKVSDHHAIIPTVNVADAEFGELPSGEQKVLSLITARFISALGDAAVRSETELEFTCADTVFKAKAKILKEKGWRDIQDWIMGSNAERADSENDEEEQSGNADILAYIAALTKGKSYPLQDPKLEEGRTTPKKHFTEDSLLSAMERAGAEEMPEEGKADWMEERLLAGMENWVKEQTEQKYRDESMVEKVRKLEAAIRELSDDEEQKFSVEELAAYLDMDEEEIRAVLRLTSEGADEEK